MKAGSLFTAVRCGALLSLATTAAIASEPGHLQAGSVYFTPTVDVETRYVDNLFRSSNHEKDTWVLDIAPRIQAWMQNGASTYSLSYELKDSTYASSHDDDFTDHQLNLDIHHEFNAKNVLNFAAEYYDGHEERGTGLSEGVVGQLIDEPVEFERTSFGGDYTVGNRESNGRLQLAAGTVNYDYQNFRNFTQFRDRDQDTLSGIFFWKVAPKTDILFEVRSITNDYDTTNPGDAAGSLDSDELLYLVGVSWDATAKTSGSIKIGSYDREYDSSARSDDDGFSWEVELSYQPRSYSTLDFGTRRFSQETNGLGDSINTEEYTGAWNHDWNSRSRTHLGFLLAEDDYSGARRVDDRVELEASYKFAAKRWLDLGLGYRYEERDSDVRTLNYELNVFFIEAELSL